METPKCSECGYNTPEGSCNAAHQNPEKYRACINSISGTRTPAEKRRLRLQREDELIGLDMCPECEAYLMHTGGCKLCPACGWSACEG